MKIKTKEISPKIYSVVLFDIRSQPRFLFQVVEYRLEEAILKAKLQAKKELMDENLTEQQIDLWDSKLFMAEDLEALISDSGIEFNPEKELDKNEIMNYVVKNFTKEDLKLINARIK